MSKKSEGNVSVQVCVRIRPRNEKELAAGMPVSFGTSDDETAVIELDENEDMGKSWPYDHVFSPDRSNQYIFKTVGMQLVDGALDGFNTVLFMYGQTSSGKLSLLDQY